MTIYVDYIRSQELDEIIFLSLIDNDGSQHDFFNADLDGVESYLTQQDTIISYKRPFMHLVKHIDEDEIKEHEMRYYYRDMFRYLEEQTGYKISLSGLARGMLGEGPQSFISKLPSKEMTVPTGEVQTKVHERLAAIKLIFEQMESTSFVNFYYRRTFHSQEVDLNDLP